MVGFNSRWDKADETLRISKLEERSSEITHNKTEWEEKYERHSRNGVKTIQCTDLTIVLEKAGRKLGLRQYKKI